MIKTTIKDDLGRDTLVYMEMDEYFKHVMKLIALTIKKSVVGVPFNALLIDNASDSIQKQIQMFGFVHKGTPQQAFDYTEPRPSYGLWERINPDTRNEILSDELEVTELPTLAEARTNGPFIFKDGKA